MKKKFLLMLIIGIIIIMISVIYNVFPRLQLNGQKNMVLSYRDTYNEPGVIVKNATGNYMSKIKISNNIDIKTIGTYYVDYSLKIGARILHVKRNVKIIDDIAPIIKLNGDQIVTLSINDTYKEAGFEANDEYDGNLTNKVQIKGEVDTSKYGEYILTYEVEDNSKNITRVNRIIKIIDEEKPKFECNSNYSAFKIGHDNPIGCKAIDNYDGDITSKVQITGNYDINEPGIYKVTYTVSDNAKNQTSINHNIIVYKNDAKKAYLTFDDGPSHLTNDILKILSDNKIKATFFLSSQENYKYLKEIINDGHEIGLHGYHHTNILYQDKETFIQKFTEFQNLIKSETGLLITTYRFPGGSRSKYLKEDVFNKIKKYFNENGITYYDWNIDSTDSTSLDITSNEIIYNTMKQIIENNNENITILFHDADTKQETVEALPTIIKILKEMNYEFDTISNSKPIQFR